MTTPNDLAAYKKMLQEKITALQFLGSNLKDTKRIAMELYLAILFPFNAANNDSS